MNLVHRVDVQENLLKSNDYLASRLRKGWSDSNTFVVNLLSSPGSGKTALLEHVLPILKKEFRLLVLEGDIETDRDAQRIRGVGVDAVQITTAGACHLEAHMLEQALETVSIDQPYDFIFVENVGNLVCPASFDLGEHLRVVLLSVPEGDDKPMKYPKAFRSSNVLLLSKSDLLPHFDFSMEDAERRAREIQPELETLLTSTTTGEGIQEFADLLVTQREQTLSKV